MSGLVYNQVWEDYAVDREALRVGSEDRVLLLSSGGCNALNTLLEDPASLQCVDHNPAQGALLRRKLALVHEGTADTLWQEFGAPAQRRWGSIYGEGAYAGFRAVRAFFRLSCGDEALAAFLGSADLPTQARVYQERIEPGLWRIPTRLVPLPVISILGVHPRQIFAALQEGAWTLERVCRARLGGVLRGAAIRDNPYWHQILAGSYASPAQAPPYLHPDAFDRLRGRLQRVEVHDADLGSHLRHLATGSITRVGLLDMPDFLSRDARAALFEELARVLAPGARALMRSFATRPHYPLSAAKFEVDEPESQRLTKLERTASYGRVTLLHRRSAPRRGAGHARIEPPHPGL